MSKRLAPYVLVIAALPLLTGCCEGGRSWCAEGTPPTAEDRDGSSIEGLFDELVDELRSGLSELLWRACS